MSVQPSILAAFRKRTAPPPVPPLKNPSEFDDDESHAAYMKSRRKAQERLREFNRMGVHTGVSSAASSPPKQDS